MITKQRRIVTSVCKPIDHVVAGLQVQSEDVGQVDPESDVWKHIQYTKYTIARRKQGTIACLTFDSTCMIIVYSLVVMRDICLRSSGA